MISDAAGRPAGSIKPIDKAAIHRICSGQVVLDLATAVKELVENSLDAGATSVEVSPPFSLPCLAFLSLSLPSSHSPPTSSLSIHTHTQIRLKEYGSELIEVADNGDGVAPDCYQALALKHHTSKLSCFEDLASVTTFGFRGEALSSLCAVAGEVSVVTRTADEEVGVRLAYDRHGHLTSQTPTARSIGTTVAIKELFKPLPVRYKEFKRTLKREHAKLVSLLQAYALIQTGVRLLCTNQAGSGARTTVVSTQAGKCVKDNVITLFGGKLAESLDEISISIDISVDVHSGSDTDEKKKKNKEEEEHHHQQQQQQPCTTKPYTRTHIHLKGYVSKAVAGSSRSAGDRQFFFINGRPVELPKLSKTLNETYRSLSSSAVSAAGSRPTAIIDVQLPTDAYDVNVTPDKRKVFLHEEKMLVREFKNGLLRLWEPSRFTYGVNDALGVTGGGGGRRGKKIEKKTKSTAGMQFSQFVATGKTTTVVDDDEEEEEESDEEKSEESREEEEAQEEEDGEAMLEKEPSPIEVVEEEKEEEETLLPPRKKSRPASLASFAMNDIGITSTRAVAAVVPPPQQQQQRKQKSLLNFGFDQHTEDSPVDDMEEEEDEEEQEEDGVSSPSGDASPTDQSQNMDDVIDIDNNEEQEEEDVVVTDDGGGNEEEEEAGEPSNLPPPSAARLESGGDMVVMANFQDIRKRALEAAAASGDENRNKQRQSKDSMCNKLGAASLHAAKASNSTNKKQEETEAEKALERVFDKKNFAKMDVLGQFNLGFIIAKLNNDLFIIDQHASDERTNFEKFSKETILNKQPLLHPQQLELSPTEVLTIRENMHVFKANGFEFKEDHHNNTKEETGKLTLSAVPFSKNITFGVVDVLELVGLLERGEGGGGGGGAWGNGGQNSNNNTSMTVVRPSRVKAMLASRACRSSIMIGRALDKGAMKGVLRNLSGLDLPWCCAHGRPTMRHLAVLPSYLE